MRRVHNVCFSKSRYTDTCRKICVLDPTNLEERSSDGKLILGLNAYRELCTLQISGDAVFTKKEAVLSCANVAASRAVEMVGKLKAALASDAANRYLVNAMIS